MSKGINKVIVVGHLGRDPETRYTAAGAAITGITVATSENWKDKQTGEKQEKTEWHNVTFFGKLAEVADNYLKKGALVYIEGRLQTDKWQDKDGNDRYTTKIIANEMQMLGSKGESKPASQAGPEQESMGFREPAPKQAPAFEDDDMPF